MQNTSLFRSVRGRLSLVLLLSSIYPLGAHAADADLRQKVDNLIATNQKNYQDVAQAMNDLTEIKQEFRSIKGQLDSSQYVMKESDRVYQDLDQRVSALEDKIGQIHNLLKDLNVKLGAAGVPAKGTAGTAPSGKEVEEFQSLLNVATARDYRNAASGFMGFLKKYPKSEYSGSAQYWVAECFYSLGDYVKSISEFQTLSEKYPPNPRVKEGIYKQGMAFMKLNKVPEAKLFFQKVVASYPGTAEAFQAQGRLARLADLEKTSPSLALNPKGAPPATPQPQPTPGAPVYRPIMKPIPMPGAPLPKGPPPGPKAPGGTPAAPPPSPAPGKPVSSTSQGSGEAPAAQDSSAPLF